MSKTLISIHDLTVRYDTTTALEQVDLEIFDDDFLGVIGPNGGGKTSLVRAILGNIPCQGTIRYAPELYRGNERLIGYLPEQPPLYMNETPLEYLRFVGEAKGLRGAELEAQIEEVIRQTKIGDVRNRRIAALSKGGAGR